MRYLAVFYEPCDMTKLFAASLLSYLLFFTACQTKLSQEEAIDKRLDSLRTELTEIKRKKIELIMNRLHKRGLFNGNMLVVERGKLLFKANYGQADFRQKTPLEDESVFRIASLSKPFTAMCIMQLAEAGKLDYQDSLRQYFPKLDYPKITLHQLLTHTSGLPDYIAYFYTQDNRVMTYANNRNVLSWLVSEKPPLEFVPGSNWSYCNTGYVLLALIVEKVSKQSYPNFLKKHILEPLNMQQTYLLKFNEQRDIPKRAYGYQPDHQTLYDDNFLNKIYGDGGMLSTVDDLYQWDQALYSDELVDSSTLARAWQPVQLQDGSTYPYGYGWHIKDEGRAYYHMGGWLGFRTALMRMPKDRHTIILLSNDVNPVLNEILEMLYHILYNEPYKAP